jgi:hypothetical protein
VKVKTLLDKIARRDATEVAEEAARWYEASLAKQLLFAAIFLSLFLLLDGSSQASQAGLRSLRHKRTPRSTACW